MDTNIVPVTEAEMTSFFQRVTTSFVALSRQAGELEEVKKQVSSLYEQVSTLRRENADLHKERDDALALAVENEGKLNDTRRHRDDLEQRVHALNETIIGSNREVSDLRGQLTSARLDAEDKQHQVESRDRRITDLEGTLASVRERRDHWQDRAQDAEKELSETKAKLQKVIDQMTTMSDILGIVAQAKEKAQEVPSPQPDPSPTGVTSQEQPQSSVTTSDPEPSHPAEEPWWVREAREKEAALRAAQ